MLFNLDNWLWWPVVTQAALFVTLSFTVLSKAAWQVFRLTRLKARNEESRKILFQYLTEREAGVGREETVLALTVLPYAEQLAMLGGLSRQLAGAEQERLKEIAELLGLVKRAVQSCGHRAWWERLHAVRTLLFVGSGEQIPLSLIKDPHPLVRAEAVRRWQSHPEESVPHLMELLDDPSPIGRFAIQNALLRVGPALAGPLGEYLQRPESQSVEAALQVAIGQADPSHLEPGIALCQSELSAVRARAATLLGSLGGPRCVKQLLEMTSDPEASVRCSALQALGHLGEWSLAPKVASLIEDPDWHVRQASALALRRLDSAGQLYLAKLAKSDSPGGVMARHVLSLPESSLEVSS